MKLISRDLIQKVAYSMHKYLIPASLLSRLCSYVLLIIG